MCNLDQVPPVGAVIVVAAPRIACANGLPVRASPSARIDAILPDAERRGAGDKVFKTAKV